LFEPSFIELPPLSTEISHLTNRMLTDGDGLENIMPSCYRLLTAQAWKQGISIQIWLWVWLMLLLPALAAKYHIEPHDIVHSSVAHIKDSFWFYFSELV